MRTQRSGDVEVRLGPGALARLWEPNVAADARLDVDLLADLAQWCDLGRRTSSAPEASPEPGSTTLLVTVDFGESGSVLVAGDALDEAEVAALCAAGFVEAARFGARLDGHDL